MYIQLMTDGGADIPKHLTDALDIKVVPLYLHFRDGEYKTGVTIDLKTFYKKLAESDELPRSSAPSPNDFYDAYKQVDPEDRKSTRLHSSHVSSSYAVFCLHETR